MLNVGYGIAYCSYHPSYNVAPGAHMPVVRYDSKDKASKEPVVHCMRWGLVPSFTKKTEKPDYYQMVRFHISNLESCIIQTEAEKSLPMD